MAFRLFVLTHRFLRVYLLNAAFVVACLGVFSALCEQAQAKNAPLTAIELYTGPNGPSYVHITDVLINGKSELRLCGSTQKIDKAAYGKLSKVTPIAGDSLEYGSDGVLTLTKDKTSSCVVPDDLKFDKNAPVSPADLAARAVLQGKILSTPGGATEAIPPLKPGVKIVFVTASDTEFAEFLRADRANTITWYQDYLSRYSDAAQSHTAQVKQSLAGLLVKEGESSIETYGKSLSNPSPSYPDLKNAKVRVDQALAVAPDFSDAVKLSDEVHDALRKLIDNGSSEMDSYKKALNAHTPGYSHLTTAHNMVSAIVEIDPQFEPALTFQTQTNNEFDAVESKLNSAESLAASKRFDDAYSGVSAYGSFAGEVPRIQTLINETYQFHFDQGQAFAASMDWASALKEFQKALDVKPTEEINAAIRNANTELVAVRNKTAADEAVQQSRAFAQQNDFIQAYEILAALPPPQKALVADELEKIGPSYIESASQTAKELQQAHDPIRGLADETSIERAYGYLRQAHSMSNDPSLKDRMDDLADRLSDYFLQQARRYLEKPLGSGAGLGWSYLDKALQYKASNLDAVRDEMTRASSAYQMRSKLSIRVVFRDQTSRRDSSGFADQLADAIATGLETTGLPIKVIRPGENPSFEPNFQLVGDVLQHGRTMVPTSEPKESKYRVGEQETPNDNWNKANRDYEAATLALQTAQGSLQAILPHNKKKEIADANAKVVEAQKNVEDAHAKLDSIPKTVPVDIIKPYTYTEKQIDLDAIVQLQFRVNDFSGNQVEAPVPVSKNVKQKFTVLENVKPEDTEGIKVRGTVPDEIQFLTDVENSARDALIEAAKKSVAELPNIILEQARRRTDDGDMDGAAESYILYLNATPAVQTAERGKAEGFLLERYNIRRYLSTSP
jgi:hypothetical protein